MLRVALKGLAGRKLRATLTALAVVLGVAMVSGTYVLTDTIQKAFDNLFTDSYANTDVVVGAEDIVDFSATGGPTVPEDLLERIRGLETVDAAAGGIEEIATLIGRDGEPLNVGGAPALAFGIEPDQPQFNPLTLVEGDWPDGPDEVVVDKGTADREGLEPGDTIRIVADGPARPFEITGIARFGTVDSIGGATFAIFDLETAQRLFGKEDRLDGIQVAAAPGVSPRDLIEDIEPLVPEGVVVQTAAEQAESESEETNEGLSFVRYFLLAFGGIALFVGAFVIFNTLSITVAQRTREFATMRTVGASRRQILAAVLVESFAIGLAASLLGLVAGIGLARLLNWVFQAFEIDLPQTGMVIAPRTIVAALAIGVGVSVAAGFAPALRATRVPPIAAVREGATLPPSRLAAFAPYAAVLTVVLALAALLYGLFADELGTADRLIALGGGCLLLFVGVALVSSHVVRPVARATTPVATGARVLLFLAAYPLFVLPFWLQRLAAFGPARPAWRIGAALGGVLLNPLLAPVVLGMRVRAALTAWHPEWPVDFPAPDPDLPVVTLARENAVRNPGRTAVTAAALMIGLALVTFVAVLGQGLRDSVVETIERQVEADYVVASEDGFSTFPAGTADELARIDGVAVVSPVRAESADLRGDDVFVGGVDPGTIGAVYAFDWEEGSDAALASLGSDGALLTADAASERDLALGDTFTLTSPSAVRREFVVRGIFDAPALGSLLGDVAVPQETWDAMFPEPVDLFVFVDVPDGAAAAVGPHLEQAVEGFPTVTVMTTDEFVEQQQGGVDILLNMLYVLLALSVVVSLFGMVNTLVLSVFERTRELGMLRAIGMTRPQARRLIRQESVVTALIGAVLGLPLGIFLAALVTQALRDEGIVFSVPLGSLLVFAVVAVLAGILAAILPARRAARLNVLEALQYE